MLSNKLHIRNLVEICAQKGINQVIISPGSRNAPLVISFAEHGAFNCLSIPDERVAGFFALGVAQQTRKPVIITCTSGTASLNFAPAIAEAFYQKIPLLVLTADRPVEWIHQGEGQSIAQRNVFANHIKRSYELPQEVKDKDGLWSANRIVCEAIDQTMEGGGGPVHINIPFHEPLYDQADYQEVALPKVIETTALKSILPQKVLDELGQTWQTARKVMILGGLLPIEKNRKKLNSILAKIGHHPSVAVLPEITSNLVNEKFIHNFDSVLSTINEKEIADFQPDLLITIGGSFISKRIKLWLRKYPPKAHWHVEKIDYHIDTFQGLTKTIKLPPITFFQQLAPFILKSYHHVSAYQSLWKKREKRIKKAQKKYLKQAAWSDLQAFKIILPQLPKNTNLHLANSTPVRYAELFQLPNAILCNANRGVAGIDGSTSTAVGAAYITGRPTTIITGDISFFYDSNAFWHHHLPPKLRIVLINNGGGNIFRFIKGPDTTAQLATYFEAQHERSAEYIAKTYILNYFAADSEDSLKKVLKSFYQPQPNNRPAILEVKTPNVVSAEVWRSYYE
ncbi:MAG: 2-succinyl-5-enolpyruvyl-6-hydroxy-3-cyclohexene-1-carboxylic-acid synthase, partial [Bacteroidota bacterium]